MSKALPESKSTVQITEINLTKSDYERVVGMYAVRATVFLNKLTASEENLLKSLQNLNAHQLYSQMMESLLLEVMDESNPENFKAGQYNADKILKDIRKKMDDRLKVLAGIKPARLEIKIERQ